MASAGRGPAPPPPPGFPLLSIKGEHPPALLPLTLALPGLRPSSGDLDFKE